MVTATKTCVHCGKEFTYEVLNFGRGNSSTRKYCSQNCNYKAYYYRNPEKVNKKRKDHAIAHPAKELFWRVKARAKKLKIPFDLEESDIVLPDVCPVLGIPIQSFTGTGKFKGYSPGALSLDRIDPKKGYIKGNVRVISFRANLLKSDATVEELELVLKDLKEIQN